MTFSNFAATSTVLVLGSGGSAPAVTLSSTYISTGSNQNLLTGNVDAIFSTVRGTDSVLTDGDNNDGTNNWIAPRKTHTAFVTDYQATTTDAIHFFTLNLNGVVPGQGGGLAPVVSVVNLCLGGTWSGSTCSTGAGNVQTITLLSTQNTYNLTLNAGNWTSIGVQNHFELDGGNANNGIGPTFLTSFDESFGDVPEPSTFILFGSALAAVAALRIRQRKQQS